MQPTLSAVRLERTRDVLRELVRSASRALPVVIGVAGPMTLALLAWAALPLMRAPATGSTGTMVWVAQTLAAAWPVWALRARLLPSAWCVQLRCLPIPAAALRRTDVEVAAVVLSPVAAAYAVSAAVVAWQAPAWWRDGWPAALGAVIASWALSCALGAATLAARRRRGARPSLRQRAASDASLAGFFPRASVVVALLWRPWWRGVMSPGGASLVAGVAVGLALAAAWTRGLVPVVPGAAWAFAQAALALALTERAQRAVEGLLDGLAPFLQTAPVSPSWRWQARLLPLLPAAAMLAGLAAMTVAWRPWRAAPLAGLVMTTVIAHATLVCVPSARREAHVVLWALAAALATAIGSELW